MVLRNLKSQETLVPKKIKPHFALTISSLFRHTEQLYHAVSYVVASEWPDRETSPSDKVRDGSSKIDTSPLFRGIRFSLVDVYALVIEATFPGFLSTP